MKKQILALLGVGTLAYGSANLTFTETQAALTAPTNWNLTYRYRGSNWRLENDALTGLNDVGYNRTGASPNFNYQMGLGGLGIDWNDTSVIPVGMRINMGFASSNVGGWTASGFGLYYPTTSYLGSDNTVGTLQKFSLQIDNQTNKDYILFYDRSSSGGAWYYSFLYDDVFFYGDQAENYLAGSALLNKVIIPSYTKFEIRAVSSNRADYFDAWYLQDLGVSASYTAGQADNGNYDIGYDDGYDDGFEYGVDVGAEFTYPEAYQIGYDDGVEYGYNNPLITNLFGSAFGAVSTIFNIGLFGGLTLGSIIIAPIAVSLLWFILGIVSGVGGKKQ
jgi:hypothetical protein